jgi:uncharacterized protein (UPF0261 family)
LLLNLFKSKRHWGRLLSIGVKSMSEKSIVILGCFDTKGEVFSYLRDAVLSNGEQVISINTGVLGSTNLFPVAIEADRVAEEGGFSLDTLRQNYDRGHAIDVMGKGAARIVARLVEEDRVKAVIGMGGGGGTYIALRAMGQVPLGIPKLCLTTLATKDLSSQIGNKDITLMPSIVDVAGINSISSILITQAAAAICAMANAYAAAVKPVAGRIAISMFGNTTVCADACARLLEEQGFEVLAFHANGVGGRTMEALIREGCFDAVLDLTTTELADDLCNGVCSAGPDRLSAAAELGVPQVVVPGCLDMVNFAQRDTVPEKYNDRFLYSWAPDVTLMRTNEEENQILGENLSRKLNASTAPVTVLLPLKGISQVDSVGGVFYRPEIDRVLFDAIKQNVDARVRVLEADFHINDPAFAKMLVHALLDILGAHRKSNVSAGLV